VICLPPTSSFNSPESWGATVLHELAHWTSHEVRLNRELKGRFGSKEYAKEELRAEITSVFVGATLGFPCDVPGHADYLASWIEILKSDMREIFRAASEAQKIADYLLAFHPDYAGTRSTAGEDDGAEHGPQLVTETAMAVPGATIHTFPGLRNAEQAS